MLETSDQNSLKQSSGSGDAPAIAGPLAPDDAAVSALLTLKAVAHPTVDDLIETLMAWAQSVVGAKEIVEAREEFFVLAGKVFHDDLFYESRINYFFDFFLLERPLVNNRFATAGYAMTPLNLFSLLCDRGDIHLEPALGERFKQLTCFRHSLFEVLKAGDQGMTVRDLITIEKLPVISKNGETYRGFAKKDIFQGFVFTYQGDSFISQGVIQHPRKAAPVIKKRLKSEIKTSEFSLRTTLSKLARQQLRLLRHQHVDPILLYQTDPR